MRASCLLLALVALPPEKARSQTALTPVRMESKWGYADADTGKIVIQPRFERAGNFSQGLAPARMDNRYGYIDAKGAFVIQPSFELARPFSEGMAAVSIEKKFGFIDTSGKLVIPPQFEWAGDLHNNRALVKFQQQYGFIDSTGKIVIPTNYVRAHPFSEGRAAVAVKIGEFKFIDVDGNQVTPASFADAGRFREGLAWVQSSDGKFGYIDTKGDFAIPPRFTGLGSFNRGIAPARQGKLWCFIDPKGESLSEAVYDDASTFPTHVKARKGGDRIIGKKQPDGAIEFESKPDPWLANVDFESHPTRAAIYKPPLLEYELEPDDDKSRLMTPEYRVSRGDTNITDKLDTRQEYMILFAIPGKVMQVRKCVPGVDPKIRADFPD